MRCVVQTKLVALLCLGEIGRRVDLSSETSLQDVILSAFEAQSEETKSAASFALGNVAVGNLSKFLPYILKDISANPKRQYLLLHSLREIISRESHSAEGIVALQSQLNVVLPLLFSHCESEEEGTRNVVSECLGKLALMQPQQLITDLKSRLTGPAFTRATVVAALKFTIVDQPQPIDDVLMPAMPQFLSLLKDKELVGFVLNVSFCRLNLVPLYL